MTLSARHQARRAVRWLVAACATVAASLFAIAANASGSIQPASPPNGVYTCTWIAAHPLAASQARVSCDQSAFASGVPLTTAGIGAGSFAPDSIDATGCQYVPAAGTVGKGVFAWSTYEYANHWNYSGSNSPADYTWYLQHTDGSNYVSGNVFDTYVHETFVPANVYRWGAQNHSTTSQQWYVCYTG